MNIKTTKILVALYYFCISLLAAEELKTKPNVIIFLADDQAYGDMSLHGNPHINTIHLDDFAKQSFELTNFYVSPVCAPTRAS